MLVKDKVKQILNDLSLEEVSEITFGNTNVLIRLIEDGGKFFISTPVYLGGNYIPKSVRECLQSRAPFDAGHLKTHFKVDEENFQITLCYTGATALLDQNNLTHLIEEFCHLAEEWHFYLDDHDKRDLVWVPRT